MVYKFLLRLDYCVHAEQTSVGARQTSAGAGRLGEGWTTSVGAERSSFFGLSAIFLPPKIRCGQAWPTDPPPPLLHKCTKVP